MQFPLTRPAHLNRLGFGLTLAVSAVLGAPVASAQTGVGLDDAAYTAFGRRDGLPDAPLLSLHPARDGGLIVATSNGVRRFTGRSWVAESLPPMVPRREYRAVLDGADSVRYFVHSFGVVLQRHGVWIANVSLDEGLAPIYSAVEWRRPDGRYELVVGAYSGVYRLVNRARFDRVAIPEPMPRLDAMVAGGQGGDADALWIGTRGGGVARLRGGTWTRWAEPEGLTDLRIEHLAIAGVGDSAKAAVATENGAFVLFGDRWRPVGPRVHMARVLRVRIGDRYETWLGALSGELFRVADGGVPQLVDISTRTRGSRAQVLTAIDHGTGVPTIYAGFRSGTLLRFRVGVAGRLLLPPTMVGHPVSAMAGATDAGGVWAWMLGVGAIRLPDLKRFPTANAMLGGGDGRVRLLSVRVRGASQVLLSVDRRLYLSSTSGWRQLLELPVGESVYDLVEGPAPGAVRRPIIATLRGGYVLSDEGVLTPWTEFPGSVRAATAETSITVASLVALRSDGVVLRSSGTPWRIEPGGAVPIRATMNAIVPWRFASGECAVIVGTSEGMAMLRTCGGAPSWRLITDATLPGLMGNEITALAVLPEQRLAVGSSRGLVVMQLGERFDAVDTEVTSITDADGLPHPFINAIGPIDAEGRLWVGTPLGAGFVRLASLRRPAPPVLLALEIRDGNGDGVFDGRRIPAKASRIDLEVMAATYHREDDTRYRFELDGATIHATPWTDRPSATQLALPAGEHVVRVRAMDFSGRESAVIERRFTVLRPPWRSPLALVVYALGIAALFVAVDRWRTRTARQRAADAEANEQRLAKSEERFRRLFLDGVNPQLLILDGKIWQANAAADALLRADGAPIVSRPINALIPEIGDGLSASSPVTWRRELEGVGPDGTRIPLEVSHTRIPLDDSTLDHLELLDLRTRKRLELERRELESHVRNTQRLEAVGTLAGGVAHDFNNLLTVIHANAELAIADVASSTPAAAALQQLLIASRRAREVVRQILTFSRQTPSRHVDIRMAALLDETQSLFRSILPSTVTLVLDNQAPDATVHGDATQLQQLLLNLCSNAEHAMRETKGGVLSVSLRWADAADRLKHAPTLVLRVSDTGGGMSDEVRTRAFEPFFTTKPVGEGTGLGLSVLHGIVGAHGGSVLLHSTLGRGTSVDVLLPAHANGRVDEPAVTPVLQPSLARAQRLLVVDDEQAISTVMAALLRRKGYDVEVAGDGMEGFQRLQREPLIDVVITDQTMPVMTGSELIEQLRVRGMQTPIILMSGYGATIDEERMAQLGAVYRLDKPFVIDDLVRLVATCAAPSRD
ncbi:response regulator [Gemmatimonas sp.]|uniref:response regulator n=1 Tax=Gemmatimonas sp. TaxID=1962908 RepID=UPI00286C2878|nr:response regulator [Gemmatimonas sp.]